MQTATLINTPRKIKRCKADQWRLDHGLSVTAMAEACGVSQPTLTRCLLPVENKSWREASLGLRKKVRALTNGVVGLSDWPEVPPTRSDAAARALSKANHHAA